MPESSTIAKVFEVVDKLGALPAAAIFALLSVLQGAYIYRKTQRDADSSDRWRLVREESIRAEEHQTTAISAMATQIAELGRAHNALSAQVSHLTTIIEERIPRR